MTVPNPLLARAIALSGAGRNPEAVAIIRQQVAKNDPAALAMLAEMTWRGGIVAQDPVAARDLFRRASARGHARAATIFTNLLASGVAGPRDWAAALGRLTVEAQRDRARAAMLTLIRAMELDADGNPAAPPPCETLSESPAVWLARGAFSAAECAYLRGLAEPLYQPSIVNDAAGRTVRDTIRTSDGATVHWMIENPAVHALNRRLAAISGSAWEQGEALMILRYRPGQEYRPHLDFVRASDNSRILTALVYLNADYRGGETAFVKSALTVKGGIGDVLVFRNALPDGAPDPMSQHAGLPIAEGTKYLASRWIRAKRWVP